MLRSVSGGSNIFSDLLSLASAVNSDNFDLFDADWFIPLLGAVLNKESDGAVWDKVYAVATESTPPPRVLPFTDQTPYLHTTSSLANSSEYRKHVDTMLKEELVSMHIGIPDFYNAYFGNIDGLEEASASVLRRCKEGDRPLFDERTGWRDWPENAEEKEVLDRLPTLISKVRDIATEEGFITILNRTVLTQPSQPLQGSVANRKLDIGLVCNPENNRTQYHWSHVLVPGELKSSSSADTAHKAWLDLSRYAREVLTAQDTRRFVLGFTLCGPNMRLWEFDRVGAIASSSFDVNKDGLQFVSTVLGFLRMNNEQLGYDPSIMFNSNGEKFIEIIRDGKSERLILDSLMKRAPCVAGRATTCWKAYRERDKHTPLVIKDSWQYPEREEEGKLLAEATEKGVINVARYYHHEIVHVGRNVDDILNNVRRGLDITQATNYQLTRSNTSSIANDTAGAAKMSRSRSSIGHKRLSDATLPPSKRTCSSSQTKSGHDSAVQNRIHRRVIILDYGVPIYKARSRASMLLGLRTA